MNGWMQARRIVLKACLHGSEIDAWVNDAWVKGR